jgi:sphingosine kinase
MNIVWSTPGTKGNITFSTDIEWNQTKISQKQIISIHYFDQLISHTGNRNVDILSNTVNLLQYRKEGNYLLLTYLTDNDLIYQIFCELKGSKPQIALSDRASRNPVLFILNPFGGTKAASKLFNRLIKPLIRVTELPFELLETTHAKHAVTVAHSFDFDKYSAIVCISGDGVFHEIINGLFTRKDWKNIINIPLGIIGAGTGNAISQNLGLNCPERAFLAILNNKTSPLDIFSYYQPGDHGVQFSHLSVAWGLIADLDIESEAYRWLGSERFTVAALIRLINFRTYTGSLYVLPFESSTSSIHQVKDINAIAKDYKNWPVRVEGDFKMFLASNYSWLSKEFKVSNSETLDSGSMQLVWSTNLSTFQGLSVLLNPSDGEWINRPEITSMKAKSFVLGI